MIRVARFDSLIAAERLAEMLREHDIPAIVLNHHINSAMGTKWLGFTQYEIAAPTKSDRDRALKLLAEFERSPMQLDADWEEQVTPDLSRLDPAQHPVECPSCGEELPLDPGLIACEVCDAEVDVVELLVQRYGPETLAVCYGEAGEHDPAQGTLLSDAVRKLSIYASRVPCRGCGYDLSTLPLRGRCPECGQLFDKDDGTRRV